MDLKEKIEQIRRLGHIRLTGKMGEEIADCLEAILKQLQPDLEGFVEDAYVVRSFRQTSYQVKRWRIYHKVSGEEAQHFGSFGSKEEAEDMATAMNIARKLREIRKKSNEIEKAGGNGGVEGLFSESLAGGPGVGEA